MGQKEQGKSECLHKKINFEGEYNFDVTLNEKNEQIRRHSTDQTFIRSLHDGLIDTFLISVNVHEGITDVGNKSNCHYEQIKENNSISGMSLI